MFVCCVYVYMCEDSLWKPGLFYRLGLVTRNQVARLVGKCLYLLSHLTGPQPNIPNQKHDITFMSLLNKGEIQQAMGLGDQEDGGGRICVGIRREKADMAEDNDSVVKPVFEVSV